MDDSSHLLRFHFFFFNSADAERWTLLCLWKCQEATSPLFLPVLAKIILFLFFHRDAFKCINQRCSWARTPLPLASTTEIPAAHRLAFLPASARYLTETRGCERLLRLRDSSGALLRSVCVDCAAHPPSAEAELDLAARADQLCAVVSSQSISQSRLFSGTNLNASVQFGAHMEERKLIIPQNPYYPSYDHKRICYRK